MEKGIKKLRIYYFKETDSMDIWFDEPCKEYVCEEVDDFILIKRNKDGDIIGIEIINLSMLAKKPIEIPIKQE
ncbi:MAG: DUF2283 domain-containing protein [Thermoproteota archaeon]|jgi:uncharacterized protein YuzE